MKKIVKENEIIKEKINNVRAHISKEVLQEHQNKVNKADSEMV